MELKIKKGVKVPLEFTAKAFADYGIDCNVLPSDMVRSFLSAETQIVNLATLLFHVVSAGFKKKGEDMPYDRNTVLSWMQDGEDINFYLLQVFGVIVMTQLEKSYAVAFEEDEDEGSKKK